MGIELTVTSKGQVTLRKEVLTHLGVAPGDRLRVDLLPSGAVQVRAAPKQAISEIFGLLERPEGPRLTIEEIDEVARAGWAGER